MKPCFQRVFLSEGRHRPARPPPRHRRVAAVACLKIGEVVPSRHRGTAFLTKGASGMTTDQSPIDPFDAGTKYQEAEHLSDPTLTRRRLLETAAAAGIAVGSAGFLASPARAAEFALAAT